MISLELLAPARNYDIGIAAVDCGADAVYIAAEEFGARKDAGNSIEDIGRLCCYAHKFGVRIYLTVNTIFYDRELERVHRTMLDAQSAGVDAFIVQDMAVAAWDDIKVPLHASTQCAVRDAGMACFLQSLGFSRLVLERELSLEDIRSISEAVPGCEIECFVHGALCVCYSGQCYLSENISRRSANRGACIQACRSLYDLVDGRGRVIVKDKALLSLKDLRLLERMEDMAGAGVNSFKIEGRLKSASYVKNVVREYSLALDSLVEKYPEEYCRASFGKARGGFTPDSARTFNRGYTDLWMDGKRGKWSSMDAPKSIGERIGRVADVRRVDRQMMEIRVKTEAESKARGLELRNGDGFCVIGKNGVTGFRGDLCEGLVIRSKYFPDIIPGAPLYRNISVQFEKELENNMPSREIDVDVSVIITDGYGLNFTARSEDGREVLSSFRTDAEDAANTERQRALIEGQISKKAEHYRFHLRNISLNTAGGRYPLISSSVLNSIRRLLAEDLDLLSVKARGIAKGSKDPSVRAGEEHLSYKSNVSNSLSREIFSSRGVTQTEDAYELSHQSDAELMRSRYCIRYELGLCPVHQGAKDSGPLFLLNQGRKFTLGFDCRHCEMTVKECR